MARVGFRPLSIEKDLGYSRSATTWPGPDSIWLLNQKADNPRNQNIGMQYMTALANYGSIRMGALMMLVILSRQIQLT